MRATVVVAGATSFYMSFGVDDFPVRYAPSCSPRWLSSGVSGTAAHIARVLHTLGDDVRLCTVVGADSPGAVIRHELRRERLLGPGVIGADRSSLGVVLVAPDGRRMGFPHLSPVNDVVYPFDVLASEARDADLVILTNAKFVRPLVSRAAQLALPIAVDLHRISDLDDPYSRPWLDTARVIFCSHERLPVPPREWIARLFDRAPYCVVAGVGMGAQGAIVGTRQGHLVRAEAVAPGGVVNTTGGGDALFATFLHGWLTSGDVKAALQTAVAHAGWKLGHHSPAARSLTPGELRDVTALHPPSIELDHWG
ncbi:carbohydrate kinase family protein [Streptosporangiaceae bacterium NEAU-GS5]|nr:carbohydrate kinase family protein [Streptosporangiaceae bacterium NEAU-GS5]